MWLRNSAGQRASLGSEFVVVASQSPGEGLWDYLFPRIDDFREFRAMVERGEVLTAMRREPTTGKMLLLAKLSRAGVLIVARNEAIQRRAAEAAGGDSGALRVAAKDLRPTVARKIGLP